MIIGAYVMNRFFMFAYWIPIPISCYLLLAALSLAQEWLFHFIAPEGSTAPTN
jgi:hypothetical protein